MTKISTLTILISLVISVSGYWLPNSQWHSVPLSRISLHKGSLLRSDYKRQPNLCSLKAAVKLYDGEDDEDPDEDDDYADRAYKEYFRQKSNLTPEEYERRAFQDYYGSALEKGLMDDVMQEEGFEKQTDFETTLERGISRRALLTIPLVSVAAIGAAVVGQRWKLFRQYTSFSELDHPLDPRTVRRPFERSQLRTVINKATESGYKGIPKVPALSSISGLQWLSGSPSDLSAEIAQPGKVVLFHFWRRSNVDSVTSLKKLEELAKKFSTSLAVVSIHSPKYDGEMTDSDSIVKTLQAAGIGKNELLNQYIISDPDLKVWTSLGIDEHPAVVLGFSGQAQIPSIFAALGERATFSSFVNDAVEEMNIYLKKNSIRQYSSSRNPLILKEVPSDQSVLKTPMGIAVDSTTKRLFISDTGNNRVIMSDFDGNVLKVWGSKSGAAGLADGAVGDVQFDSPQGLVVDTFSKLLWIADSGNDCLRRLSLQDYKNIVSVKAQYDESVNAIKADIMEDFTRTFNAQDESEQERSLYGLSRTFRTPVAVAKLDSFIYVSAASSNQLWRIDDAGFRLTPVVGSGIKGAQDYRDPPLLADRKVDSLLTDEVRFAEPSGLCGFAGRLYVSDSDSSSIRQVNFRDNSVTTVLGGDKLLKNNLALFGDRDGTARGANFQHPTGLCVLNPSTLLLSDTLNHKVKLLTVVNRTGGANKSRTFVGNGKRGYKDGNGSEAEFNEPTAVAYDLESDQAWICDTMNNQIRVVDMVTSVVSTLKLKGL